MSLLFRRVRCSARSNYCQTAQCEQREHSWLRDCQDKSVWGVGAVVIRSNDVVSFDADGLSPVDTCRIIYSRPSRTVIEETVLPSGTVVVVAHDGVAEDASGIGTFV